MADEDLSEAIIADRQRALNYAIGSVDDDPNQAHEAINLGRASGVDPSIVYGDVDGFKGRFKATLTSDILRNSPYLTSYVNSNPLAAKVSNDDWANLDNVTKSVSKFGAVGSVLQTAAAAAKEAYGEEAALLKTADIKNPLLHQAFMGLWQGVMPMDTALRVFNAAIHGAGAGIGAAAEQLGLEQGMARRLTRDLIVAPQLFMPELAGFSGVPGMKAFSKMNVQETFQKVQPWLDRGEEPPVGLDPVVDRMKGEQAKLDRDNLDEMMKASQQSVTRERAPEMYADFVRQQVGDARIEIPAETVAKLYGDKMPYYEDGLLGWVDGIERQMYTALATGGDISIPLADWLARVDPEVAKALRDDIRARKAGLTVNEAKDVPQIHQVIDEFRGETEAQALDPTVTQVRRAAGLDPLAPGPREGWDWSPAQKPISLSSEQGRFETMPIATTPLAQVLEQVDFSKLVGGQFLKPILDQISKTAREVPVHLVNNADYAKAQGDLPGTGRAGNAYYAWGTKGDHIVIPASSYYSPNLPYYVLHEAVHAATAKLLDKDVGFQSQISTLMGHLKKQLVAEKSAGLKDLGRYGWTNAHEFLAEAVSNRDFQAALTRLKVSEELAKDLNLPGWRGRSLWEAFVEFIRMAFGADPQAYTGLDAALKLSERIMIEQSIEMGRSLDKRLKAGGEGVLQAKDPRMFDLRAPEWMTKAEYEAYAEGIRKRNAEDIAYQLKKAEALERKKQTAEWKAQEAEVRAEVETDLLDRPDMAVAEFFRTGRLYGEDTGQRPRVNPKSLTPEQEKLFPERYLRRDGMNVNDVSQLFGYPDVDAMIDHLARLEADMKAKGHDRFREYFNEVVKEETDRRMLQRHGDLEANILRDAQEHVVSPTQMDLLHEETFALAQRTGSEFPFQKADLRKWAETKFGEAPQTSVSLEGYLKAAGKAGRRVEKALLERDFGEAFKAKQEQYLAVLMANEAKKFAKEQEKFSNLEERFSKRVVKGIDQPFADWIQRLLLEAGSPGRRTEAELREATARVGDLRSFVDSHRADGWELAVDESVLAQSFKPLEQMTVQEYRDFASSLQSLDWVGKKINQVIIQGEKQDFADLRAKIIDNIRELPKRGRKDAARWLWEIDALLVKTEEVLKDLDLRQELGPLHEAIIVPLTEAKHTDFKMVEDLTARLKEISNRGYKGDWRKSLKDPIPNDIIWDPQEEKYFTTTRQDMINVMLHFGNSSNIEKFVNGYAGKENGPLMRDRLLRWFEQYAKPEDAKFVQEIWDLWEPWRKQADDLYYELAGVPPKWIPPEPIRIAGVDLKGGYFPIVYDEWGRGVQQLGERAPTPQGVYGKDYFRATPGNSYTKERTGFVNMVKFQGPVDDIALRMQQMIHDIAYRKAVIQTGKIIYDTGIRDQIVQRYGPEYAGKLDGWLKDTANKFTQNEKDMSFVNKFLAGARANLVSHALGFNPNIIFSPSVAKANPADWYAFGLPFTDRAKANGDAMVAKSRELAHTFRVMDRDYREYLERSLQPRGRFSQFRADAIRWGYTPTVAIEQYFRKVTFFTEYNDALGKGATEGEAIGLADTAVRERHGSGAVQDLPRIMRTNEFGKLATIFYGWFNMNYNYMRQIPGQIRREEYMKAAGTAWATIIVPTIIGGTLFQQWKQDESIFAHWGKAFVQNLAGMLPLAREMSTYATEGFPARTPLNNLFAAVTTEAKDMGKFFLGKPTKKPLQHGLNVIGLSTGLPLGQIGRTAQFGVDVYAGKQRPRDIWEWIRGLRTGEAKMKK